MLATIDDAQVRANAEQEANRVLGLPGRTELEKTDDPLDKVIKILVGRKMEKPKQTLMGAYAKNTVSKIRGR